MPDFDTRLIQYDSAPASRRSALLTKLFQEPEELESVGRFLGDPFARSLLEFMLLDAVPYEEFALLREHGYAEVYREFATYVPAARGLSFPEAQLTEKARSYDVFGATNRGGEAFIEGLVLAYRARTTGQGIVAGRIALEDWLDKGDEGALSCVVDPMTGGQLDAWGAGLKYYGDLVNPFYRERLIARRACDDVALPVAHSQLIHDTALPSLASQPSGDREAT